MHVIERFKALEVRDPREITSLWRNWQILFYFLCAISGYICSILFYVIWFDISGENCPLWADLRHAYHEEENSNQKNVSEKNIEILFLTKNDHNWTLEVSASFGYGGYCNWFHISCLVSCLFGVVGIVMFFMCGKGGYEARMYTEAWRILIPASSFNLIFTIIIVSATGFMKSGMSKFVENVNKMADDIRHEHSLSSHSQCQNLQDFMGFQNIHGHDVCKFFIALNIISWMMIISWIGGTIFLILRIINLEDFRLLNVTIYEMTPEVFHRETLKRVNEKEVEAPIPRKRRKIVDVLCCRKRQQED